VATTTVAIEPWVDTETVAAHLNKPVSFIYNRAEELGIPRIKIGNVYRYRLSEVDKWLEGQRP
jgi:excisionase family DNA binding protein